MNSVLTTSLPTEELDSSDSDLTFSEDDSLSTIGEVDESSLISYVVRITPCGKFTKEQLYEFIKYEDKICNFVIAHELEPREHYHLVIQVDNQVPDQAVRDIIRAFIVPFWYESAKDSQGVEQLKLPRGFGNKQYNLQISEDLDLAVSYAVKDKIDIYFEGFSKEYINERIEASFKKKSKNTFKIELLELRKTPGLDIREFMIAFAQLKAKYDQGVRLTDAHSQALSYMIKQDPSSAESFVEDYLYKQ